MASELWAAGWECKRSADDKEWVCISGKGKPGEPAKTPPESGKVQETVPAPQEPHVELAKPAPVVPPEKPAAPSETSAAKAPPARSEGIVESEQRPESRLTRIQETTAPTDESSKPQVAKAEQKPGWTCKAGPDKNWDCGLVGADPQGAAHSVGAGSAFAENWAQSPDMTPQDEMRFRSVMAHLPDDPWRLSCGKRKYEYTPSSLFLLSPEDEVVRMQSPLEIHSDSAELLHGEVSNFQGTADLARADQRLYGDFVTHNNVSGTLNAKGNVIYREKGLSFASDTAFLRLNSDQGVLRNSQFVLETIPARGTSRLTYLDSKTLTRYETVTYTTCPPGNQDWLVHADSLKMNKETGQGVARNAWVEFKGVPFLYTPIMSFPVDDRRQSGLLTPLFGYSKIGGFSFTQPYYLNLAPNYDATLSFREISNRGQMGRAEFRYLSKMTRGLFAGEFMPYDQVRQQSRGSFIANNWTEFTSQLRSRTSINYVTDDKYLNELGNILNLPNNRFMRSYSNLTYAGAGYNLLANVDYNLSIDSTIKNYQKAYSHLPQLVFNSDHELFGTGFHFASTAEADYFYHPDSQDRVTGQRYNLRPKIYFPYRKAGGFITPGVALQFTQYALDWQKRSGLADPTDPNSNIQQINGLNVNSTVSDSLTRVAPIFSVDSGMFFDREFKWGGTAMQQTLEPRLFYLYIPKIDQSKYPLFDSAQYDFTFYQLFRENRFAGIDRLGDSNQLTTAMTSRFIDQQTGLERLKLSLGQIFYFQDREVTQSNNPADIKTYGKSNLLAEVSTRLTDDWSFRTTGQWRYDRNWIDRGQVALQYNDRNNHLFNVGYRYRRDPNFNGTVGSESVSVNQTDVSLVLPVAKEWNVIGRWQYDLLNSVTTDTILGVEKETCCWRFSLIGLRYLNGGQNTSATQAQTNYGVFFQFELKGLTRLGDQLDNFLSNRISGYRRENEF